MFMPFSAVSVNLMLPLAGVIGGLVTAFLIILLSRNNPQYLYFKRHRFFFCHEWLDGCAHVLGEP
ncbi:hypothetical protein [Listeria fleischmannii]|uniref:hypothetical protein n=1 Tax=Listeria fleischmannii TaxID=1069827 RepID=UPI003F578B69